MSKTMKTALTIAGSDSGGGAGIQADIKTMTMNGVFATSAITALTAQNTLGVRAVYNVSADFLRSQLEAIFDDIPPDAVKVGMVSAPQLVEVIAEMLYARKAPNIVVDPVMVATSGAVLASPETVGFIRTKLIPLAKVITPNIPEAEILAGREIKSRTQMEEAAKAIGAACGCAVLLKGGHHVNDANDLLYADGAFTWFEGRRVDNPNTHGTGCTLSSAIAANLAKGFSLEESIRRAKDYISRALGSMLDLGHGSGPLDHLFDLTGDFAKSAADKT